MGKRRRKEELEKGKLKELKQKGEKEGNLESHHASVKAFPDHLPKKTENKLQLRSR